MIVIQNMFELRKKIYVENKENLKLFFVCLYDWSNASL